MKTRKHTIKMAVASASLLLGAVAAPANAAAVVAGPGSFAAGYDTPATVTAAGGAAPLMFVNGDIQPHNVIANANFLDKKTAKSTPWCSNYPKKKCPIFWSETIPLGGQTEVLGLENTESGQQYSFFCSIHPGMKGTLVTI